MKRLWIVVLVLTFILSACGKEMKEQIKVESKVGNIETEIETNDKNEEVQIKNESLTLKKKQKQEQLDILIKENLVFNPGQYGEGEVPAGTYAVVPLDDKGSINHEENPNTVRYYLRFETFGYVDVLGQGPLETEGLLININTFDELGVQGARELYMILNEKEEYSGPGYYWVGKDIDPGEQEFKSEDRNLKAALYLRTGPPGIDETIEVYEFTGEHSVVLKENQVFQLARASIIQ